MSAAPSKTRITREAPAPRRLRQRLGALGIASALTLAPGPSHAQARPRAVWLEDVDRATAACVSTYDISKGTPEERGLFNKLLEKLLGGTQQDFRDGVAKLRGGRPHTPEEERILRFFDCVAENVVTTTQNPFFQDRFYGIELGSDRARLPDLGAHLVTDQTDAAWGKKTVVNTLLREPTNTTSRWFFFRDGYGLYRVLLKVGAPGGNLLTPDGVGRTWVDLSKKIAAAGATVIPQGTPNTYLDGFTFGDLRECPKGNAETKSILASWTDAEFREARQRYWSPLDTKFMAIECGLVPPPRIELTFPGWPSGRKIIVSMMNDGPAHGTVNVLLIDQPVADIVWQENHGRSP
jgi:hypothetical protein